MTTPPNPRFPDISCFASYWRHRACAILHPITLAAPAPSPGNPRAPLACCRGSAYVHPSPVRRWLYCETRTALQDFTVSGHHQASPANCRLYLGSCAHRAGPHGSLCPLLEYAGHPPRSAPGPVVGGLVLRDEVAFHLFPAVGGHYCRPVSGELTYGLERLAMYVLGVKRHDCLQTTPRTVPLLWRHLPPARARIFPRELDQGPDTLFSPSRCRGRWRPDPGRRPADALAATPMSPPAYDAIKAAYSTAVRARRDLSRTQSYLPVARLPSLRDFS